MYDYNLWFWHAAYGYAGTLNNKTILSMSPWLGSLIDGSFAKLEECVVPFHIGNESFKEMFVLVDGIYPAYTRFVRGIKSPVTEEEKKYTGWQEAARKDIERAFGVLKGKWQCLARPMTQINLQQIGKRVGACLVLHNMCVSDRVMDDNPRSRYNPAAQVPVGVEFCKLKNNSINIQYPPDLKEVQGRDLERHEQSVVGVSNMTSNTTKALVKRERWMSIQNNLEYHRLHKALSDAVNKKRALRK